MVWSQSGDRTAGKTAPVWVWSLLQPHIKDLLRAPCRDLHKQPLNILLFAVLGTIPRCAAWHEICQCRDSSGVQSAFWTSQLPPLQRHNSSKEKDSTVTAGTWRDISRERDRSRTRTLIHGKGGSKVQGLHSCCTREKARQAQRSQWPACHLLWTKNGSNGYRTLAISYVVSYISSEAPVTGPTENMKEYGHSQRLFCQAAMPRFQK